MKLQILFFVAFFTCAFVNLNAQNYPYLNASTGNEESFVIDADSNIYLFHNCQIEKLDKNFNPVWVKTYNDISFFSLLLSKNGSIYFIASDTINYYNTPNMNTKYVGKIDALGNLVWCKTADNSSLNLTINFYKLLLDRNNNLIASCNKGLMKLDTLGNMFYFKQIQSNLGIISDLNKATILKDSSGYYSCAFSWNAFESSGIGYYLYSEALDSFIIERSFNEYPQFWYIDNAWFYKSKYDPDIYYSITIHRDAAKFFSIRKHRKGIIVWNKKFGYSNNYPYIVTSFDEDKHKNILFNISPLSMGFHTGYTNNNIKLDSNGIHNGIQSALLNYSWWPPSKQYESVKLQSLYNNKYYYTIVGNGFPSNPLSITLIDSTLLSNCSVNSAITLSANITGPISTNTFLVKQSITPYLLQNKPITIFPIINFSIAPNYCIILGINENNDSKEEKLCFYPNPCQKNLNIQNKNGLIISSAYIIDINGKQTKVNYYNNQVKTDYLSNGIYFIKVETNKGDFSQKFIKE